MIEDLVKKSLAAYREGFFFSCKPKVKPTRVELRNGLVLATTGKITIEGKLSGLSLLGEEYWRRAHDIVAIHDVACGGGNDAFDFGRFDQFQQVLDEYTSSIHVLLDEGLKGEARAWG